MIYALTNLWAACSLQEKTAPVYIDVNGKLYRIDSHGLEDAGMNEAREVRLVLYAKEEM